MRIYSKSKEDTYAFWPALFSSPFGVYLVMITDDPTKLWTDVNGGYPVIMRKVKALWHRFVCIDLKR